jgi:hypothetical protein
LLTVMVLSVGAKWAIPAKQESSIDTVEPLPKPGHWEMSPPPPPPYATPGNKRTSATIINGLRI